MNRNKAEYFSAYDIAIGYCLNASIESTIT